MHRCEPFDFLPGCVCDAPRVNAPQKEEKRGRRREKHGKRELVVASSVTACTSASASPQRLHLRLLGLLLTSGLSQQLPDHSPARSVARHVASRSRHPHLAPGFPIFFSVLPSRKARLHLRSHSLSMFPCSTQPSPPTHAKGSHRAAHSSPKSINRNNPCTTLRAGQTQFKNHRNGCTLTQQRFLCFTVTNRSTVKEREKNITRNSYWRSSRRVTTGWGSRARCGPPGCTCSTCGDRC